MKKIKEENEQIGEQLKTAILNKYGTQEALAEKLGMSQGNLSNRLKNPSRKFMKKLEKVGVIISNNKNKNVINGTTTHNDESRFDKILIEMGKMMARIESLERKIK